MCKIELTSAGSLPTIGDAPPTDNNIYRFQYVDASTLSVTGGFSATGSGTFLVTPVHFYENATAIGAGAELDGDNTVVLGNGEVERIKLGAIYIITGSGTPEGAVTAPVGSLFTRTDGGASTTLYVKESGTSNTGWVAK